jgi:hypothetical protein
VTFGGSTAAGTKALLELNELNPDKDVEYNMFVGAEMAFGFRQRSKSKLV